jgi:citrate synthase
MPSKRPARTRLCRHTADAIYVRGQDLVNELIGKVTFTEMLFLDIMGCLPSAAERSIVDAVLVTLIEHGLAPSAVATRMVYASAPEALQGAVAAGLAGAGSNVLGTIENAAALLRKITTDPAGVQAAAQREVESYRAQGRFVPGFGHPHHRPDDPRSPRLLAFAEAQGVPGNHIAALRVLAEVVDRAYGKHLTINATGAVAALLCEIDIPTEIARGFGVIARAAGLVAHVREEQQEPSMWEMLRAVEAAVPYEAPDTAT